MQPKSNHTSKHLLSDCFVPNQQASVIVAWFGRNQICQQTLLVRLFFGPNLLANITCQIALYQISKHHLSDYFFNQIS